MIRWETETVISHKITEKVVKGCYAMQIYDTDKLEYYVSLMYTDEQAWTHPAPAIEHQSD